MLDFVFGVEHRALIEAIADAEHGAGEVSLRLAALPGRSAVVDLAVPPEAQSLATDARYRDPGPVVVGLKAKGRMRRTAMVRG